MAESKIQIRRYVQLNKLFDTDNNQVEPIFHEMININYQNKGIPYN